MATEEDFHEEMLLLYDRAKQKTNNAYRPTRFLQAVRRHGGITYAKRLLKTKKAQLGFSRLQAEDARELSVEALVTQPEFAVLFTPEEIAEAQRRMSTQ